MEIDFNKMNQFIQLFQIAEKLLRLYNRSKDLTVLSHFNWVMDRSADLLGSMTQQEFEYCDTLGEIWEIYADE